MARGKSIQDIIDQRRRIEREMVQRAGGGYNMTDAQFAKFQKVRAIGERYVANIRATKSFQRGDDRIDPNNVSAGSPASNRKYARSTYMGLANG